MIEPIKLLAGWVMNYAVALRFQESSLLIGRGTLHEVADLNNGLMQSAPTFEHLED